MFRRQKNNDKKCFGDLAGEKKENGTSIKDGHKQCPF
jgi:hypothetical protein